MRKIILAPDSFKGTMSSIEVCNIMKKAITDSTSNVKVIAIPIADGGEGTVDAFLSALGGDKIYLKVRGPFFTEIDSFYGILPDGTAIIEMAAAAGLSLVGNNLQVGDTTTYGVGKIIKHAVNNGCTKIILGLGGSATNDGGCGAAAALGVIFKDINGKAFIPVGKNLGDIYSIDAKSFNKNYRDIEFVAMCDINNPLSGENGAAAVFGPQKGADAKMIAVLDKGLTNLANVIQKDIGKDISNIAGAGAAGGMGGGMVAFFNCKLQKGIKVMLETVKFEEIVQDADYVFTGEGKIDAQSSMGKVISGVAGITRRYNIPLVALTGNIEENLNEIYEKGVTSIFSINTRPMCFEKAIKHSRKNLYDVMKNIIRLLIVK